MREFQTHDGDISVSEMARLTAKCMSISRITANSVDAGKVDAPAVTGQIVLSMVQPGLIAAAHRLRVNYDSKVEYEIESALGCGILISGDPPVFDIEGHGQVRHEAGRAVIAGNGKPVKAFTHYKANQHNAMGGVARVVERRLSGRRSSQVPPDGRDREAQSRASLSRRTC